MIKINLLPIKELKQRRRRRQELFFLVGSLAVLLLLLAMAALTLNAQINGLKAEIVELDRQKASLQSIQRQITALQRQQEALETKISAIRTLRTHSQLPVRVLDEISNRTPSQRMWLNSLRLAGNTLTIAGVGLDNPTIAQYMQTLERSPYFAGVDLASTAQTDIGGQKLKTFSLTIRVTPPAQEAPEGEGAQ
ncbi:PilN domain-containing protein [Desulfurivibrio sp. D14AmB]|uniref:PilN domain-containing protein n=1 Tax=Desulfurivibrio sp. D14AmB TaxID=3374370 RepID=UPI00376F1AA3